MRERNSMQNFRALSTLVTQCRWLYRESVKRWFVGNTDSFCSWRSVQPHSRFWRLPKSIPAKFGVDMMNGEESICKNVLLFLSWQHWQTGMNFVKSVFSGTLHDVERQYTKFQNSIHFSYWVLLIDRKNFQAKFAPLEGSQPGKLQCDVGCSACKDTIFKIQPFKKNTLLPPLLGPISKNAETRI